MKSRAEQIREQASRVAAQPSNRSRESGSAPTQAAPKSKRIGKTVNLDVSLNQRVAAWQIAAATSLGIPRVTFQTVIDCLLEELLDDERLASRVRERLNESP